MYNFLKVPIILLAAKLTEAQAIADNSNTVQSIVPRNNPSRMERGRYYNGTKRGQLVCV